MLPPTLARLDQSEMVSPEGLNQRHLVEDLLPWSDTAFLADLLRLRKEADVVLQSPGFGRPFLERSPWAIRRLPGPLLDRLEHAGRTRSGWFASAGAWGSPLARTAHAEEAAAAIAAERAWRRRLDDEAYTRRFLEIVRAASTPLLKASSGSPSR